MEPLVWLGKVTDCDVRHVSVNGVAKKAGLSQTTLARRLKIGDITSDMAIAICRAYKYPVVRGLRELGFITDKDFKAPRLVVTLQDASDRELAEEIVRRLRESDRREVFDRKVSGTPDSLQGPSEYGLAANMDEEEPPEEYS